MANVFGILTAIVLALASFVAYKNKAAYATEITETATRKANLTKSQARFKTAQDNLAATIDKRTAVDAEVVAQTEKEAAQKKANEDLTQANADKKAKIEPNKAKIEEFRAKTAKVGDLNDLAAKMKKTNVELEEITQAITDAEAKLANVTAQNNQAEAQAEATKTKFEKFTSGQSLATLNTRIRSIYPTWGFVTLASGNNGGVVANSTLDVVRGSTTIAKLMVTSVESNSASASIIPDSMAQDTVLMIGDRVVPAYKAPAPVKPAPAPQPAGQPAAPAKPALDPGADPFAPATDPTAPATDPAAPATDPAAPATDPAAPAAEVEPAPATN